MSQFSVDYQQCLLELLYSFHWEEFSSKKPNFGWWLCEYRLVWVNRQLADRKFVQMHYAAVVAVVASVVAVVSVVASVVVVVVVYVVVVVVVDVVVVVVVVAVVVVRVSRHW